jgi:hypothetical protein
MMPVVTVMIVMVVVPVAANVYDNLRLRADKGKCKCYGNYH